MAEVQSIGEINKVKDLTTEEKLEKKRAYHREYMKMRRTTDEKFADRERERNNAHKKYLYKNDLDFKEKPRHTTENELVKVLSIRQNMRNYSNK